jgi:hypothetical protein
MKDAAPRPGHEPGQKSADSPIRRQKIRLFFARAADKFGID